jgi:glycosyltransferase involved in cell wall biosynthesis
MDRSSLSGRVLSYFRVYLRFCRLLKECKPDIVHAGFAQTCGLMAAASGFHPFLLTPLGTDIFVYPERSTFVKLVTRYVIKHADMLACDSQTMLRAVARLSARSRKDTLLIPWGVDLERFAPNRAQRDATRKDIGWEDKQIVIITRNFHPVYAIEDFVSSLPTVFAALPDARALFIGDGPLLPRIKSLANGLSISHRVRFVGRIANDDMPNYLNAADLYVSSSLSDSTSVSLLEAFACALPVVVTDVPTNLEWVKNEDNGLVVPRGSPEKLSEAIVKLLQVDPDERILIGQRNARVARERADWDHNFETLWTAYCRLAQTGQRESLRDTKLGSIHDCDE